MHLSIQTLIGRENVCQTVSLCQSQARLEEKEEEHCLMLALWQPWVWHASHLILLSLAYDDGQWWIQRWKIRPWKPSSWAIDFGHPPTKK